MLPQITTQPYYIYAPPYRNISAGIKALYLLCHYLNTNGYKSYIVPTDNIKCYGEFDDLYYILNAPIIDQNILEHHKRNHCNPIIIYSDAVEGNPLMADNVVRYMMNYSNLFIEYEVNENELLVAYSAQIAKLMDINLDRVLFIPTSDPNVFYPSSNDLVRSGSCVYLGKYHDFHHGDLHNITQDSIIITRGGSDRMSPHQMANLFRKSEIVYLYENSAIAIEAVLCGCPAAFIPNKTLKPEETHLAKNEIGLDGYALNIDNKSIIRAKETVNMGRKNYLDSYDLFQSQLDDFIKSTQNHFPKKEKNQHNIISCIYLNNIFLMKERTLSHQDEFDKMALQIKTFYPNKKATNKFKLLNSNKRIIIKTKFIIKSTNIGRTIKDLFIKLIIKNNA
jgi:hypothetical protein